MAHRGRSLAGPAKDAVMRSKKRSLACRCGHVLFLRFSMYMAQRSQDMLMIRIVKTGMYWSEGKRDLSSKVYLICLSRTVIGAASSFCTVRCTLPSVSGSSCVERFFTCTLKTKVAHVRSPFYRIQKACRHSKYNIREGLCALPLLLYYNAGSLPGIAWLPLSATVVLVDLPVVYVFSGCVRPHRLPLGSTLVQVVVISCYNL